MAVTETKEGTTQEEKGQVTPPEATGSGPADVEVSPEAPVTREQEIEKAVHAALSQAGRDTASISELRKQVEKGMAELKAERVALQKQKEEEEEERFADDMPALVALRAERRKKADDEAKATELTEREARLATRETELADIVERDRILKRTELAAEVAVEKGVSIDAILKLAKEDTREAYEAVAELLPQVNPLPVLYPHSSRTNKGGIDVRSLSPDGKIRFAIENPGKKMI